MYKEDFKILMRYWTLWRKETFQKFNGVFNRDRCRQIL